MIRVGIIGPESTGKSTLCRQLSEQHGYLWIKEYAREYVEALDRPYTRADLDAIAGHLIEQISTCYSEPVVLFDTELIIMKVWYESTSTAARPMLCFARSGTTLWTCILSSRPTSAPNPIPYARIWIKENTSSIGILRKLNSPADRTYSSPVRVQPARRQRRRLSNRSGITVQTAQQTIHTKIRE